MATERKYWIASEQIADGRWVKDTLRGNEVDEVLIAYWNPETKAQIDAKFVFRDIGRYAGKPVPWFEIAEDGWPALAELGVPFLTVLAALAEDKLGRIPTVDDLTEALGRLGFENQRGKLAA